MIDLYINNLTDPDPNVRREAVIQLGKLKDTAALPALADVYRNDSDPEIRELALKAGKFIRAQTSEVGGAAGLSGTAGGAGSAAPARKVSGIDRERAIGYLNQAIDWNVKRNDAKAAEFLARAFDLNPELANDPTAAGVASELTGLNSQAAVDLFMNRQARAEFLAAKQGRTPRKGGGMFDPYGITWGDVLPDLGIYGLAQGATVFIVLVLSWNNIMSSFASQAALSGGGSFSSSAALAEAPLSIPLALVYGVIWALVSVLIFIVQQSVVHLVATNALGGSGTIPGLLRKVTLFSAVAGAIAAVLQLLPTMLGVNTVSMSMSASGGGSSSVSGLGAIIGGVSLLVSLGIAIYSGQLTGEAYDFGTGKGCLSIFLGGLVLAVAVFCCAFTFGSALIGMLSSLAPTSMFILPTGF